jgi:hypothetical protein
MGTSNNYLDSRAISLSPTSYSSSNYSAWSTSSSPSSLYALKNMPKPSPISGTRDGVAQASAAVHSPYGSYKHRKASSSSSISYRIDSLSSNTILSNMPLSLQERRTRNKTASAKYRAKRNQQHGEMRAMIDSLTKENELLLRQLENVQFENGHLKSTCDKLRGKIMAQKMIKQYLDESGHQQNLGDNAAAHRISYEQTTIPDLKE